MNPVYWLLIVIVCAVLLCTVIAGLFYGIGWDHCDEHHAALDAERHRHREQDPMPGVLLELPPGPLSPFPEPERCLPCEDHECGEHPAVWRFSGGWDQGPASVSAEYELLTQTAEQVPGVDTPSDFIDSMTAEVDAMVAEHARQTNKWIHSMPRVIIDG